MKIALEKAHQLFFYSTLLYISSGLWLIHDSLKKLTVFILGLLISSLLISYRDIAKRLIEPESLIIMGFAIVSLIVKYTHGGIFGSLTRSFCLLFFFYISINRSLLTIKPMKIIIIFGLLINTLYIIYNVFYLGLPRPNALMNPNIYAPIFGVFLLCNIHFLSEKKINIISLLVYIACIYSVLQMQSRGVIIASTISAALSILLHINKRSLLKNKKLLIFVIPIILSLGLYQKNTIIKLYQKSFVEYNKIIDGNLNTSIGQRIQMLSIGFEMIKERPLIGHGNNFASKRSEIIKTYDYSKGINNYNTLHNVYLDSWAKLGIFGLIAALFFTIAPMLILNKNSRYFYFGVTLSLYIFIISAVDTALLGGQLLILILTLCYMAKITEKNSKPKVK